MKRTLLLLLLLLCISIASFSQANVNTKDTVKKTPAPKDRNMFGQGIPRGVTITTDGLTEGYVMFAVPNSASVYLINRKGEVVHEWKGNYGGPTTSAYLLNDGSLIQNALDPDFPIFAGGGEAGRLQKITWDNKIVWDFEYANEKEHTHHDFTVMPNGNILAIAWEAKTANEVLAAGRKPKLTPKAGLWPDKIVEIKPDGERGGKIVWEWHIWDHLIQNYDSKKANFGKPADHPELLDLNVGDTLPAPISKDSMAILKKQGRMPWRNQTPDNMGSDVYHVNAIKYNAELDQIVFSSPDLNEIFIIDHSTTTKEAAGHKGGRWGKGGDFLYRWGNPENYHRGDSTTRKLFHQHDIRWIEKGKPGAGNLMLFNNDIHNRDSMNYSAVYEISPPRDQKGNYLLEKGKPFGPEKPVWTYIAPDSVSFWSSFISGAHRMSNGNTFINEGAKARFFEVTKEGKIVWEYLNPYRGEVRKPNGDPNPVMPMTFFEFRSTFIPADHPGLANRKLGPINPQPKVFVMPSPPPPAADKK
ncbi:MAG: aryl-sulfate sulfotransferase [Chitinophagaceae bacterium]